MQNLFLIILFTSLFSGLIVTLLGNKIGLSKIYYSYFFFFFVALFYLITNLYNIIRTQPQIDFHLITVLCYENYFLNLSFKIDKLTVMMLFVVLVISFKVCMFSIWYMKGDPNHMKFLNYLNYFMFFMILLVTGDTLTVIFIGWEGIGIFSYLLINFWNDRLNANRSAFKAVFVNKIGDSFIFLLISIYNCLFENKYIDSSENFLFYFMKGENVILNFNLLFLICASLFVAGVAKSAQFILHVWLPDAMEGPTPVSALLHAATMVTAGAYVIIKFNWILLLNDNILYAMLLTGILTNFISSFIACFQSDIKKIIAYSTASQMGLIFVAIGMYKPILAFYHLFNHAFFKALLFILAGIIIHFLNNKQDLRFFSNLKKEKFFLYSGFFISISTLSGVPFLSAFYSKDLIIQFSYFNFHCVPGYTAFFLFISVFSTLLYSCKILINIYYFDNNNKDNQPFKVFFLSKLSRQFYLNVIVYSLSLCSVAFGWAFYAVFTYEGVTFSNYIDQCFTNEKLADCIYLEFISAQLLLYFQATVVYRHLANQYPMYKKVSKRYVFINDLISRKFYFDSLFFYVSKFSFSLRNIAKEEKVFNEYSVLFYLKNIIRSFNNTLKFIYSDRVLSVIFLFYAIVDIFLFVLFTKIFIFSWILLFTCYILIKIIRKIRKKRK